MKKPIVFLLILVLFASVVGAVSADKLKYWVAYFTYDVPAGTWADVDTVAYEFEFNWTYPPPGDTAVGSSGEFDVSDEAPLYPGYVVFRGNFGAWAKPNTNNGRKCMQLEEPFVIHPDQPVRFHIGWGTDELMTAKDARAHFESMVVTVDWGDGDKEMTRHEITPPGKANSFPNHICRFTVRH